MVLLFIDGARTIFDAIGPMLSICILLPFGIFLFVVTSMFFLAFGQIIYSLLQPIIDSPSTEENPQKQQNETPNNAKKIFNAAITFILAVGTLLLGIGTYQAAQQSKYANELKQQEIQIIQQKSN